MAAFRSTKRQRASTTILDPWQLLRQHGDALAAAARDILGRLGDVQLAGIVVAPGNEHGDSLRALLAECHGSADPDRVCVGLVPRALLGRLLPSDLVAHCRALAGPQQLLPIVVSAPTGLRFCSVPCGTTELRGAAGA